LETLRRLGISPQDWRPGLERLLSLSGAGRYLEHIKYAESFAQWGER
jgi:hypothetical protein